jgi:hypothetical protein
MTFQLSVHVRDAVPILFELADGEYQLGCHDSCQLHVVHDEMAERAAQIDVRDRAVFLRNFNPFPIYVGDHEVRPNEETEWPEGQVVLFTKNISLAIANAEGTSDADADLAATKMRQWALCAVLFAVAGVLYLLPGSGKENQKQLTHTSRYDFSQLVEKWMNTSATSTEQERQRETVLNYFIDARVSDIRWGHADPRRAIAGYELLLDSPLIQRSKPDSPGAHIRVYALARVSDLSSRLMLK